MNLKYVCKRGDMKEAPNRALQQESRSDVCMENEPVFVFSLEIVLNFT